MSGDSLCLSLKMSRFEGTNTLFILHFGFSAHITIAGNLHISIAENLRWSFWVP